MYHNLVCQFEYFKAVCDEYLNYWNVLLPNTVITKDSSYIFLMQAKTTTSTKFRQDSSEVDYSVDICFRDFVIRDVFKILEK